MTNEENFKMLDQIDRNYDEYNLPLALFLLFFNVLTHNHLYVTTNF